MTSDNNFDAIIIGGSYAGLSAAMALGRAMRDVLIIDSGVPCNRQTPHSHNFITQDGEHPGVITQKAKAQVLQYGTVEYRSDIAVSGTKTETGFVIGTQTGGEFTAKRLVFATGVSDMMPDIKGFAECWGITVVHCPYCHGYEVRNTKTGILANGAAAYHYAQLLRNWTKDLTIFTNGESALTPEQVSKISGHGIAIVEKEIASLNHENGDVRQIVFRDRSTFDLETIYAKPDFEQHCKIPEVLGCALTEYGYLQVDHLQKTTVAGVFACGDNASAMRAVANAVATGNLTGAAINNELTEEEF